MDHDESLLIFLHIPRAGGTSLWSILSEAYGGRVKRVRGQGLQATYDEVCELARAGGRGHRVIGGHVPFGVGRDCPGPVRYLTVLRDPTDIMLSRHFKRMRPEVEARKLARRGADPQTTRIGADPETPLADVLRNQQGNPMTKLLSNAQASGLRSKIRVTRSHLDEAKENLEQHFAAVAFVEDYDESIRRMANQLGWSSVPQVVNRNPGRTAGPKPLDKVTGPLEKGLSRLLPGRDAPVTAGGSSGSGGRRGYPQEIYDLGREVHELDYELYDFARRLSLTGEAA